MKKLILILLLLIPFQTHAQEVHEDLEGLWRAKVIEATEPRDILIPGTDIETNVQNLTVRITSGPREGEIVTFQNDYTQLTEGDRFYLKHVVTVNNDEYYSVHEVDRTLPLLILVGLFVAVILILGGKQGFRSLLSLVGSLLVLAYVLIPALLKGFPPIPTSILVAGLVLFFAIFFTHGFNRRSVIAFSGTIIAVGLTGALSYFFTDAMNLTGLATDESVYLNANTGGTLNFVGLLLAAVIIGALGVLDDIAITQVAVVRELFGTSKNITKREAYKRAMRVGKEHVGALVNTLVLAYTGAALPLLLLFSLSGADFLSVVNREIFATEIVRSLVGGIGLVLAVPITTFLATVILSKHREKIDSSEHLHSH